MKRFISAKKRLTNGLTPIGSSATSANKCLTFKLTCDKILEVDMRKNLKQGMIFRPKTDAVTRLEAAQDQARKSKRMVKEALEAIRLSKPYKRDKDAPTLKEWDDKWLG